MENVRKLIQLAKDNIGEDVPWSTITKLDLSGKGLSELPDDLHKHLPNLSILFLSDNHFAELPPVIGKCPKLQMVAFKNNNMKSIHPQALQPQLRWLILTNNQLTELPSNIGHCGLQKLMLSGNKLKKLPSSLSNCSNLELIRLASNELTEAPLELLRMPSLKWVALSDNPFLTVQPPATVSLPILEGLDETSGTILGQGAGGVTRKIDYKGVPVAVKVYSGNMTSDGLPAMEKQIIAIVSTLQSAGFIELLGQSESGFLVTEFLDKFRPLGGPPSMETCTRDVYNESQVLSWDEGCNLLTVLLEALRELHSLGVTHGDFYAHNILVSDDLKSVKLSDFGAAYLYDKDAEYGNLIQNIELRAFGVLVEEVAKQLNDSTHKSRLEQLHALCFQSGSTFDSVSIWLKQRSLSDMAEAFGGGDE